MNFEINATFENEYIFVKLTGQDSYQASLEMCTKIAKLCVDHKCLKVLVLSDLTPLETMEAYNHFEIYKKVGITSKHRIAVVEKNLEAAKKKEFIETVLANRGYRQKRLFSDLKKAQKWLLKK